MNEFNMQNKEKNTTEKYRSCVTYERVLSPDTLTCLFENGWKLISFNGFGGTKEFGFIKKDNIPQELRGLIAAQFTNKYHRPAMIGKVNDEGYFRGSLRGSESFAEVPDFKAFLDKSGFSK